MTLLNYLVQHNLVWLTNNLTDLTAILQGRNYYTERNLKHFLFPPMYLVLLLYCCTCFLILSVCLGRNTQKKSGTPDINLALIALSTLVVPSTSRWSPSFLTLARRGSTSCDSSIVMPLSVLHTSVKSGKIELRNTESDLASLFRDTASVYGWRIRLKIDGVWCRRLHWSTITSRISSWKYEPDEVTSWTSTMEGLLAITSPEARISLLPLSDTFRDQAIPVLALDAVPESYLLSFVRDLQNRSEGHFILTCVTRSTTEPLQNRSSILASIPFLFPRYSANGPAGRKFVKRGSQAFTSTMSTHSVIKILTSKQSPFAVEYMRNVSGVYANALRGYVERLETDKELRAECIKECGVGGWREEKFWSTWEAALFSSGILSRWVLLVTKCGV